MRGRRMRGLVGSCFMRLWGGGCLLGRGVVDVRVRVRVLGALRGKVGGTGNEHEHERNRWKEGEGVERRVRVRGDIG